MALKQNKDGYVLTLNIHPDEIPHELLRDFVGARYQVVMVRLGDDEMPLDRREHDGDRAVKLAGVLCREKEFWDFLVDQNEIFEPDEKDATDWLRRHLGINSRSDLKTDIGARERLSKLSKDYNTWKRN